MAEVVKKKETKSIVKVEENEKKVKKEKKSTNQKPKKEEVTTKQGLWTRFIGFLVGVKNEASRVRWTSKQDMLKYSVATIVFIVFFSLFFYGIDAIFAFAQSLFK